MSLGCATMQVKLKPVSPTPETTCNDVYKFMYLLTCPGALADTFTSWTLTVITTLAGNSTFAHPLVASFTTAHAERAYKRKHDTLRMCGTRKICQRGSNIDIFVGGRIRIPLLAGHKRPASETPFKWRFRWRADDGPTLEAALVTL